MDNPVTIVKSNLTVGKVAGFVVVAVVVFAILDVTGFTDWILFPVRTARNKFKGAPASA